VCVWSVDLRDLGNPEVGVSASQRLVNEDLAGQYLPDQGTRQAPGGSGYVTIVTFQGLLTYIPI
jgi:hypothetical protein